MDRKEYFRQYQARRKELAWSKCKLCGFKARRLPKIGCLECYARKQSSGTWVEWTDPEKDTIERYAGRETSPHLQVRLYRESGIARTIRAIQWRSHYVMGIKTATHQEGYTIAQLVEITGHPRTSIKDRIKRENYTNIGTDYRVLLSIEDGDRLIETYRNLERPSYSTEEAARLLGYEHATMYRAFRNGLPSWRKGTGKRVCKATVDRAVEYLKTTGKLRIQWRSLVSDEQSENR